MVMSRATHNHHESTKTSNPTQAMIAGKYNDYANETIDEHELKAELPMNGRNVGQVFPLKLHYMLSDMEAEGLTHIVAWRPHGRCFAVLNQKEFAEKMLPLWFQQTKFASFQRQLNLYCFRRITKGPDKGCYYHEFFLRGKQSLCCRIKRMKVKGNGRRKQGSSRLEPNFSEFAPLPSTATSILEGTGQGIRARLEQQTARMHSSPVLLLDQGDGGAGGGKINMNPWFLNSLHSIQLPVVCPPLMSSSVAFAGSTDNFVFSMGRELRETQYLQYFMDPRMDAFASIRNGPFLQTTPMEEGKRSFDTISAASPAFLLSASVGPSGEWLQPKYS